MRSSDGSIPAPIPTTEAERLRVLHSFCVFDTPAEPVFEDLTRLGSVMFNAPIVLISLMDEQRQFFKSAVGLSLTETPRDSSFCAYTMLSQKPMVVLDAFQDDRFRTNPLVTGYPHIRFYAGAPLISRGGVILGSFCIIDQTPRNGFCVQQQASLGSFAHLAVNALEQRLFPVEIARIEQELLDANERYLLATQATTEGIWDWNCRTGQLYKSARMRAIVGLESKEARIPLEEWFERIHPADRPFVDAIVVRLRTTNLPSFETDYRVKHEDGTWRWVQSRATAVRDSDANLLRVVGSFADITHRKYIDPLTGLHTRASLLEVLDQRKGAESPTPFALLVLDLDLFKDINSSLGREGGDTLLDECARRLEGTVANTPSAVLARLSRDEFALLINGLSDEDALMYAGLLQGMVQVPFEVSGRQVALTSSIGIAMGTEAWRSGEELIQRAEAAAHQSKRAGGARSIVFSEELKEKVLRRMTLLSDLRDAVANESLELHYQPKIDLSTEKIIGFEALSRWNHPAYGYISPEEFIPLAEEGDLILPLGRWTLREAIHQLADWREKQLVSQEATMAVNLSSRQFSDGQLIDNLRRKLTMHALPASCLSLEVTEGILILDITLALATLRKIRELGVHLDLDDFGTGYSSLSYLQQFPFDSLKVDRSFVKHMENEPERATLVRSILALAHALKLRVVAEGIETREQWEMLREMGCEIGQGYYFSKPLAAADMESYLSQKTPVEMFRPRLARTIPAGREQKPRRSRSLLRSQVVAS